MQRVSSYEGCTFSFVRDISFEHMMGTALVKDIDN